MRAHFRRHRLRLLCVAALLALDAPTWAEPPAHALVGEIPFHPDSPPSRVMIDLAPDGQKPFVMMLDTGASDSVLTTGMARELGVSVRSARERPYRKGTRLGRDLQFWVDTSSSDTGSKTGWEYGLLGGRFLDDYVVEIDYPGRVVRFYDPDSFEVPEQAQAVDEVVIPFRRSGTRILADLEIDGKTVLTLLDTGAPAVIIAGREARRLGIDWEELPQLDGVRGVLGPIETYTYPAKQLRFGGFAIRDQPISIAPKGSYNQGGPTDSALGYDVLKRFVMRIDYANKRIWLKAGGDRSVTYWGGPAADVSAPPDVAAARSTRLPPSDDEVAENDARQISDWEQRRKSRVYAETAPGRFVVVDGYRLREGPKDGEVWYSHDEMLERKRAVESGADSRD